MIAPAVSLAGALAAATRTLGEFELIERYFKRKGRKSQAAGAAGSPGARQRVVLGIGDDCALLAPEPGMQLAISTDMLVEGRHFLATVPPERLAHKALAVNLSDLAACGAEPLAFTLALALPAADAAFLAPFADGLFALADAHGIELIGGDATAGPLNISITVFGQVPAGGALLRRGAGAGDDLWVSGQLGDARLALEVFRGTLALDAAEFEAVRRAMECPQPRVALGRALRGIASAAIDLSDGLVGDLGHVLAASNVGAVIDADALPRSAIVAAQAPALQRQCVLAGGDDYELLFTAPPQHRAAVEAAGRLVGVPVTRFGRIDAAAGLQVHDAGGQAVEMNWRGFDHFA